MLACGPADKTPKSGHTTLAHWVARVTVEYQRDWDSECTNLLWADLVGSAHDVMPALYVLPLPLA